MNKFELSNMQFNTTQFLQLFYLEILQETVAAEWNCRP